MIRTQERTIRVRLKVLRRNQRRSSLGDIGSGYGQCGMTSTPGWCHLPYDPPDVLTPCSQIRECDQYTGAAHFEYALPGGPSPNADINVYNPTTGTFTYQGANAQPAQSPFQIAYNAATGTAVNLTQPNPALPYVAAQATATPAASSGSAPATPATYHPTIMFANLTSGDASRFAVGDRWKITISGAQPGAAIRVTGGKGGAMDVTPFGQADSQGNWSLAGQMTANEIGDWYEKWTAGDTVAGELRFTVAPPPRQTGTETGSQTSNQTTAGSSSSDSSLIERTKSLPWYVWAIAAGGAYLLLEGGRRR